MGGEDCIAGGFLTCEEVKFKNLNLAVLHKNRILPLIFCIFNKINITINLKSN